MSESDSFFDTNVLVSLISGDAVRAHRSEEILAVGGVVSAQILNEFTAVARRKFHVPWAAIRDILWTFRETLAVVPMTIEVHTRGLDIAERYSLNVYDGLILAAADLAGCGVVYSEDMHDGLAVGGVTVRNPYVAGEA